jgi:hypothetical protein
MAFFLLFAFSGAEKKLDKEKDALSIKIKLIREYYIQYHGELYYEPSKDSVNEKRFDIELSLINRSNKKVSFWIMTSCWEENFFINNSYIFFVPHNCNHNFPTIVMINPFDSALYTTTLRRILGFDNPCKNCIGLPPEWTVKDTKVGFLFIDSTKCKNEDDYEKYMGDKSIWDKLIWSNSITLNK